ncbi:MAG: RNA methyltransferase [Bacteroidaceae bacterium]|nr:RNA methyltransferase [Bacteroidaceae bacterium]MBR1801214.1 RNA methyltransferase [Bacteroidaceae bacterium]
MRKLKITEMGRMSLEQFHEAEKMPLVVVLDGVRSLYNVGSVFRTGDAFRIAGVVLCGITATPPNAEIHKTALGAEDSVAWRHFEDTMEAVRWLREEGYTLLAVEQCEGSTMLQDFTPELYKPEKKNLEANNPEANNPEAMNPEAYKKYAVILGNEVKGVQQQVVDACDGCLEIPQFGTKHSMNVSVTAGIVIWHFAYKAMQG